MEKGLNSEQKTAEKSLLAKNSGGNSLAAQAKKGLSRVSDSYAAIPKVQIPTSAKGALNKFSKMSLASADQAIKRVRSFER